MITRDAAHNYFYEGVQYPGVTNILGALDKSGPLMGWAARETATAAVRLMSDPDEAGIHSLDRMLETLGRDGVVRALTSRSSWTRDEAAQLGTDVHALAEKVVHGHELPATMTDTQRKRVEHYARWWEASGWTLRLSEAMVIRPGWSKKPAIITIDGVAHHELDESQGWGGTFDLLAYDRDHRTVLADVKTGKGVYKEAVLQLAAYGMASLVQPNNADGVHWVDVNDPSTAVRTYPMPLPDRYCILHVTAEGVREIEVAVGTAERMAFLACLDLHHWIESMKGKRL